MSEVIENTERVAVVDLEPKMRFDGRVTRVELYGAFVDYGAERDGLVHISQISEERVNRVADALNEGDQVSVWVHQVDKQRGRVRLTMIEPPELTIEELEPNQLVTGTVTKLVPYGAFVDIGVDRDGLIHVSELSDGFVRKPSDVLSVGSQLEVRVVKVDQQKRRIELSLLELPGQEEPEPELEGDDEEEGDTMTAMELAWRSAMERQGMSIKVPTNKQGRRRRKSDIRREQASIIARTLQSKKE
jgi:transcriptional accessory protein Tex/SPT6